MRVNPYFPVGVVCDDINSEDNNTIFMPTRQTVDRIGKLMSSLAPPKGPNLCYWHAIGVALSILSKDGKI